MRVLSLFSGGGLGDYGLELAGMEIVGQVEIDEYCQKILNLRWPVVPKWRDIRDVKGAEVLEKVGRVDLISGGFPCQDISTAGKGAGITGERSGLWKEMLRIICEVRPRYVLVENVTALLGRGLGVVLGDLAESGYDCEWDCIPASAVGAPHQRDRVWIVAYTNGRGHLHGQPKIFSAKRGESALGKSFSNGGDERIRNSTSQRLPDWAGGSVGQPSPLTEFEQSDGMGDAKKLLGYGSKHNGRSCKKGRGKISKSGNSGGNKKQSLREIERDFRGIPYGVASRVDRLKLLGNGQVVQVVQWIGERIMEFEVDPPLTTSG